MSFPVSESFFTSAPVSELSLIDLELTEFFGAWLTAYAPPPSATKRAMIDTARAAELLRLPEDFSSPSPICFPPGRFRVRDPH
jgi:hypothetical protein